ncbi:MAG: cation:proton antiporter domain-containing protein [Acidimicrobiales bacterium]
MNVFVEILVVLIAAKVAAELAERIGLPAVVGEILAGIAIGPSLLGVVHGDEVLRVLGELGVILLLVDVGLQMDLKQLGAVGRSSALVAMVGVAAPFALGWAGATALGLGPETSIFLGAALSATSVGITARVFGDLRALTSLEARTVLGAAVIDDVMGLIILTVVVKVVSGTAVSIGAIGLIIATAFGFLALTTAVGIRIAPPLFRTVNRLSRSPGTLVAVALAFTLAFAELATLARLAPIVGAFVAGLALARSDQAERIRLDITPVGHLFIPVFFLQIGIDADVSQFANPTVLILAAVLTVAAVVGKMVSAVGAAGTGVDGRVIGLGMLPRGEVGLIFAGIGLREGVLGNDAYAALLLVVLGTTLAAPPLLRARLLRKESQPEGMPIATPMPSGGWFSTNGGDIEMEATPAPELTLHVALQAALLAAGTPPGPGLLNWLSTSAGVAVTWDEEASDLFFLLLARGNGRSWRLLEAAGILDRALPELSEALARRRADPFRLDPLGLMRWNLVDRVHELAQDDAGASHHHGSLAHPEWLALAALILEITDDSTDRRAAAHQLATRLNLGPDASDEVALLVSESELLLAASSRTDGLTEANVIPIALHLERPERARALYLLSLALGPLDQDDRQRLDQLTEQVLEALAHPELTGRPARNVVERRRAEAIGTVGAGTPAARRVSDGPLGWVLAQESNAVARQARILDPLPGRHQARVVAMGAGAADRIGAHSGIDPDDDTGVWTVEVVARDQIGLLAAATQVLADVGLEVIDAVIATWPDGAALESFSVCGPGPIDTDALARALSQSLGQPVTSDPVEGAEVFFDGAGSPWCTLCDVRASDRPGLLRDIATAFATTGVDVHSARVTTLAGTATDRFEITVGGGVKLSAATYDAIRAAVAQGSGQATGSRRRVIDRRARRLAP